jgi:hypothetical protein
MICRIPISQDPEREEENWVARNAKQEITERRGKGMPYI